MIPATIAIAGMTGTEPDSTAHLDYIGRLASAAVHARFTDAASRYQSGDPEIRKAFVEENTLRLHGYLICRSHRAAAGAANDVIALTDAAARAQQTAGDEYASLTKNTTVNWLAAHHRFVLATMKARTLMEQIIDAATEVDQHRDVLDGLLTSDIYTAHIPAENRITMPYLDQLRLNLATFIETSTDRFAATRATITGGYPAGFEPAPAGHATVDDEIAWTNSARPATPAVVAAERNW